MSEWDLTKLKFIAKKIGSGATPRGGGDTYLDEGISLIRSQNVYDMTFSMNGLAFISEEQAEELKNVHVMPNDVLLNITGDSVARCCSVPNDILPARVNQHVAIIRADTDLAVPKFIEYSLCLNKESLLMMAEIGATRKALTKGMLEDFEIPLPPLPEQQAIAEVLSSLDDKIDLLHRNNKTLEEMAETLFRQWFVEGAKEEWEVGTVNSLVTIRSGFAFKSTSFVSNGRYKLITIKNVQDGYMDLSRVDYLDNIPDKTPDWCKLVEGDILLSLTGNVGRCCLVEGNNLLLNQRVAKLEPKNKRDWAFTYFYFRLSSVRKGLEEISKGTAQANLSPIDTGNMELVIPSENVLISYSAAATPLLHKILANKKQVSELMQMRDTLLPKLMSGQVRVKK